MRYDGGARQVLPDGSLEIVGSRRMVTGPIVGSFIASMVAGMVLTSFWPTLFPLLLGLGAVAWVTLSRRATRRVLFDVATRTLRIVDRGRCAGERTIAFSDIRSLRVEQLEPRRIANAPPVLTVNGTELLSVMDGQANANLEQELQALVGLPLQASPRDTSGWSGL